MRRLGMLLVLSCIFILILVKMAHLGHVPQSAFDTQIWKGDGIPESSVSRRRVMVKDLVTNILPGLNRSEIEQLLGRSPKPEEARIAGPSRQAHETPEEARRRRLQAGFEPGVYYFDDHLRHDWDLAYFLGKPSVPLILHGIEYDPEDLLIRLGDDGRFESWYIVDFGQTPWEKIVGSPGNETYRESR